MTTMRTAINIVSTCRKYAMFVLPPITAVAVLAYNPTTTTPIQSCDGECMVVSVTRIKSKYYTPPCTQNLTSFNYVWMGAFLVNQLLKSITHFVPVDTCTALQSK